MGTFLPVECLIIFIFQHFILQASDQLHKVHTRLLVRKYIRSITVERKTQVSNYVPFHCSLLLFVLSSRMVLYWLMYIRRKFGAALIFQWDVNFTKIKFNKFLVFFLSFSSVWKWQPVRCLKGRKLIMSQVFHNHSVHTDLVILTILHFQCYYHYLTYICNICFYFEGNSLPITSYLWSN